MLRELQLQMMEALYEGRPGKAAAMIAAAKPEARARLHVYCNNARQNYEEALAATYPVTRRLVGEAYFRQLTRALRLRHASRSGDLQQAGERLPHYLSEVYGTGQYQYLAEMANFEWLVQEASIAPDSTAIDLSELAQVEPCDQPTLRFKLHPAARLFRSAHPILRIWEANVDVVREPDVINLDAGADQLIILRHESRLRFHRLSAGEHHFLSEIEWGSEFGAAVDMVLLRFPDLDISTALQRCIFIGAIADFEPGSGMP